MVIERIVLACTVLMVFHGSVRAESPVVPPPLVMDNSFYIEEAYNQEPRVVQHVFTSEYFRRPERSHGTSFTQEWPLWEQTHQFSYAVLYDARAGGVSGVGDLALAYRYQLAGEDDWAALAPTLAVTVPTGNKDKGLGNGVTGFAVKMPASRMLTENLVTHWNVGASILPAVPAGDVRRTLVSYLAGASVIWLATPSVSLMLESLLDITATVDANGEVLHETQTIVNPGARFAINLNSLQIVPGLAVPLRFVGGEMHAGGFVYLSFEHPF